jgi:hypothetical protein
MSTVWIKHSELGVVSEVPESSVPFWRQAGWAPLTKAEQADLDQSVADGHAEAEAALRRVGDIARGVDLPPVSEPPSAARKPRQFVSKELLDPDVHPTEEDAAAQGRAATPEGA